MLTRMTIKNLTVFPEANLQFARNLNVFVGENGAGKTHLLKMAYTVLAVSAEGGRGHNVSPPTKSLLQMQIARKLISVFRPEQLGRLATRKRGRERCDISMYFDDRRLNVDFSFATNSKTEVNINKAPSIWSDVAPAFLPTRELMTIFPNFVATYETRYLEFEETWRDTCILLGAPLQRGPKERQVRELLAPLEAAMQGQIELDKNGRFYLRTSNGTMEMPLVAEGLRKLGMLSRLIATGALLDKGYLFWDEPEANLNPKLVEKVAESILSLCASGIQVFIATHSLFLLRELEILSASAENRVDTRFFGIHQADNGCIVEQGPGVEDIGEIAALDEELKQSDRFLADVS